jgi:5-amino-6-(5-phosphoribosylamino)uracil reductase
VPVITTAILAMSADGKISAVDRRAPREPDAADLAHLELQTSLADLVLVGAGTMRAEGAAYTIRDPQLVAARAARGQPPQPITCVVSHSLDLPTDLPFFDQPIRRWLLTTGTALVRRPDHGLADRAEVLALGDTEIDWSAFYALLEERGIGRMALLGGGALTAALIEAGRVDDWWLTIWPLVFGGKDAPSPVEGHGFAPRLAPRLQLIETRLVGSEVFLHYRLLYDAHPPTPEG